MGGKESFLESENKIMKKIAKAVLIDKVWSLRFQDDYFIRLRLYDIF
jgi:hypothetical protein